MSTLAPSSLLIFCKPKLTNPVFIFVWLFPFSLVLETAELRLWRAFVMVTRLFRSWRQHSVEESLVTMWYFFSYLESVSLVSVTTFQIKLNIVCSHPGPSESRVRRNRSSAIWCCWRGETSWVSTASLQHRLVSHPISEGRAALSNSVAQRSREWPAGVGGSPVDGDFGSWSLYKGSFLLALGTLPSWRVFPDLRFSRRTAQRECCIESNF